MKIKEEDQMLEEVYATRRKISERCGNDPKRYMAGIRDIQRRATEAGLSFLAYCQAAINRGGTVDAEAMQKYLDEEMAVYSAAMKA